MVKYLIKTLIISIIFFTNSVKAERLDKLKFHNVLEEFGNPFYSAELSQANSTKFIFTCSCLHFIEKLITTIQLYVLLLLVENLFVLLMETQKKTAGFLINIDSDQ